MAKTPRGRVYLLTSEKRALIEILVKLLVSEAESGESPKKMGRPRIHYGPRSSFTFRIAPEDAAALRAMAADRKVSLTTITAEIAQRVITSRKESA